MLWDRVWVQKSDGLGEETPPKSLSFCHQAAEALTRWQQSEKTVTRVVRVLDDFDSSASAAFEVDVLQRGESRSWDTLSWTRTTLCKALPWVNTLSMVPKFMLHY